MSIMSRCKIYKEEVRAIGKKSGFFLLFLLFFFFSFSSLFDSLIKDRSTTGVESEHHVAPDRVERL